MFIFRNNAIIHISGKICIRHNLIKRKMYYTQVYKFRYLLKVPMDNPLIATVYFLDGVHHHLKLNIAYSESFSL